MKKLETYLKLAIYIELCLGIINCLHRYIDFRLHPIDYAVQSAPWYLGCIVNLVYTAIAMGITTVFYFIVRHKNRSAK